MKNIWSSTFKFSSYVPLPLANLNSDLRSDGKVKNSWQVKPNAEGLKWKWKWLMLSGPIRASYSSTKLIITFRELRRMCHLSLAPSCVVLRSCRQRRKTRKRRWRLLWPPRLSLIFYKLKIICKRKSLLAKNDMLFFKISCIS